MENLNTDAGNVNLVIQDDVGKEVLNTTLDDNDDEEEDCTGVGTPGEWTIIITITDFFGEARILFGLICPQELFLDVWRDWHLPLKGL